MILVIRNYPTISWGYSMKYTLNRIGARSVGKLYGCIMATIALLFAVPLGLVTMFGVEKPAGIGIGLLMMIGIPLGYGLLGFVMGIIMTAIFNFCAKRVGGIEFTAEPKQ